MAGGEFGGAGAIIGFIPITALDPGPLFPPTRGGGGTFVPEIAAVEADNDLVFAAVEQAAEEAVAERHGFIPGIDGGGKDQILSGGWRGLGRGKAGECERGQQQRE